jgi:mono/diheme cytochrome c family protein
MTAHPGAVTAHRRRPGTAPGRPPSTSTRHVLLKVKPSDMNPSDMKMNARNTIVPALLAFAVFSFAAPAFAQLPPSAQAAEDARFIAFGKEIFKSKAVCQYCHKWDASGDQGYGGNALSLRKTQLTPEQMTEVVKCGRPATGMPYHDRFAYTDKRCYGYTREQMGNDMPPAGNDFLSNREVDAVVKYLFAKDVGKGPATYEDCVDFWGTDTKQCDPMKK